MPFRIQLLQVRCQIMILILTILTLANALVGELGNYVSFTFTFISS
jgi:hypothetical protein